MSTRPSSAPVVEEVLSEAEVLRRLPIRKADATEWLRDHVRPRRLAGRLVYRWSEVWSALPVDDEGETDPAALETQAKPPTPSPPAFRRSSLLG